MLDNNYDIKMDGEFHQFEGGGIRYTKTGKGRFDLIPPEVIDRILQRVELNIKEDKNYASLDDVLISAYKGEYESSVASLVMIIYINNFEKDYVNENEYYVDSMDDFIKGFSKMLRELAVHYEKGAEKYGVDNWKKGIPEQSFRDSGLRHLCQWISGETDEPHHIAAIWNFFGAIWKIEDEQLKGFSKMREDLDRYEKGAEKLSGVYRATSARFKDLCCGIYKCANCKTDDEPVCLIFPKKVVDDNSTVLAQIMTDDGITLLEESNAVITIKQYSNDGPRMFTIELNHDNINIDIGQLYVSETDIALARSIVYEIMRIII